MKRSTIAMLLIFDAGMTTAAGVLAQGTAADYPQRPIRVLVGFPPGGATDILARILAGHLAQSWGQQFVIDNRGGATGTVAASIAAKAAPDGYTLMMDARRLKPIAVTSLKRSAALPGVPTIAEAGVPLPAGLEMREWYGMLAPAGTSRAIVDKLNAEMVKIFRKPEVQARLSEMGAEPAGSSPAELAARIAADVRTWAKVVKESGVRAD